MASDSTPQQSRDFGKFGWQGINLTVPTEWELISTSGDFSSGYASLADQSRPRLQIKWDTADKETDPGGTVSRYVREVRKKAKKEGIELSVERHLNLASHRDKKVETYEWVGSERGLGMVANCGGCERIVHLAVLGEPEEQLRNLARTVFASLTDHPEEGGHRWKFYDVLFMSPAEIPLKRAHLKTGCIRLLFEKKGRQLEFVRVSLAEVLLGRQDLEEWFSEFYESELKHWGANITDRNWKEHAGLAVEGEPPLIFNPGRLLGRRKTFRAAVWHCAPSNRIFIVRYSGRGTDAETFREAVSGTACCNQETSEK